MSLLQPKSDLATCVSSPDANSVRSLKLYLGAFLLLLVLLASSPSFASLGGDLNSVLSDQLQFQGNEKVTQMGSYEIHEIQVQALQTATSLAATPQSTTKTGTSAEANATVVREYVSPAGVVFAVTWHGPFLPNMRQLLGSHFQQFVVAMKQQASSRLGRRPLQVVQPDFVVHVSGNSRSHAGRAYLPEMLPSGLQPEAIQ
jgi:hypothetical protein